MDGKKRFFCFVKFLKALVISLVGVCCIFFEKAEAASKDCDSGKYLYGKSCETCPAGCYCPEPDTDNHLNFSIDWPQSFNREKVATWCTTGTQCYPTGTYGDYKYYDGGCGRNYMATIYRCAPGSFSSGGASKCTLCSPGKYASGYGATSCVSCAAGTYASGTGNTSCTSCAAGTYASLTGSKSCTACVVSKYASGTGNTSCKSCPSLSDSSCSNSSYSNSACSGTGWYYGGNTGKTTYSQCIRYKDAGASGLENCASGKIKMEATSATAWGGIVNVDLKAKAGYYVNGVTCSKCTKGDYSPAGNSLQQCYSCPTPFNDFEYYDDGETWQSDEDCVSIKPASKIANCSAGGVILYVHHDAWVTDQLNDNNYGSLRAKKGYEVTVGDGDLNNIKCTACKPGTWQSSDTGTECQPCNGATDENHTQCKSKCGDGEYVDTETKTCKKCPCADGATSCPITQDDFDKLYNFVSHSSTTTQQGINSCTVELNVNKSVCGPNTVVEYKYSQSENKYVLQSASKILYGGTRSITKTNANFGEDWCEQCKGNAGDPDAEYPINDKCEKCGIGNYVVDGTCAPCPAGHKCDKYGATVSEPCPIDTYAQEGSSSCTPCPTGYATLSNKDGICKAGPEKGKYKECTSFDACKSFPAQLCYSGKCPIISGRFRPQQLFPPYCNTLRSIRTGSTEINNGTSLKQLREECGSSFSLGNGFKGGTYFMDNVSIYKGGSDITPKRQ